MQTQVEGKKSSASRRIVLLLEIGSHLKWSALRLIIEGRIVMRLKSRTFLGLSDLITIEPFNGLINTKKDNEDLVRVCAF
jgi:hypothetical protein